VAEFKRVLTTDCPMEGAIPSAPGEGATALSPR
jgi:hypothetical protein